jgi:HlyD family secretion protein
MSRARLIRYMLVAAVLAVLLLMALRTPPRLVDSVTVGRGEVIATVDAEGRTRVRDRFLISAPIAAQTRRLLLQPGDGVAVGDLLIELDAPAAAALDPRSRAEAGARADAAAASVQAAAEQQRSVAAYAQQAGIDAERLRRLAERGLIAADQAEHAETARLRAERDAASARFQLAAARHQHEAALAALRIGSDAATPLPTVQLRAPVDGLLLRRHVESARTVQAGEPLLEIGDPSALEVEVDVLSADAVRLRPGMAVQLLRWGEAQPLRGRVRRVEPGGFTKISALGVEEQRVWVIVDIDSPRTDWPTLGDAYRVDARFVLDRRTDVLRLPASALFRLGEAAAVFRLHDGRAEVVTLATGLRGGAWVEVQAGLASGDTVIVHPDRDLAAGDRVRRR